MRVKLTARGSGRWQQSAGSRSKFGLTATELLQALDHLKAQSLEDCFQLLHFHLGSQIPNIRTIKEALDEGARIYAELHGAGAGLKYFDVGGGLGVDYDGSRTNFDSSTNYTLTEYANDVVYHTGRVCDETGVPHPTIISESGRALVAHHSMLIFTVLGTSGLGVADSTDGFLPESLPDDAPQPLIALLESYRDLGLRNTLESWHDAQQSLDMAMHLFKGGYLSLKERCIAENLFWAICRKLAGLTRQMEHVPEELERLDDMLSDTYFCNFSLFQSIPDSWAIRQLFPIMPIHHLDRRPDRLGVLADVTCDSDGKIDRFVDRRDVRRTLPLHAPGDQPYYLGAFMVGAYQEILGDLHNLFGDTNAVHVSLDDAGEPVIETIVASDTVREVLNYVEFDGDELIDKLRRDVQSAVAAGRLDDNEATNLVRRYQAVLGGSTYLGS
jgi:arginine decarboxylase